LKEENDLEVERSAGGKLFHARGPATANACLQSMPDVLVVPPDQRSMLSVADDVRYGWQTLSGPTSITVPFRSGSRTPAIAMQGKNAQPNVKQ